MVAVSSFINKSKNDTKLRWAQTVDRYHWLPRVTIKGHITSLTENKQIAVHKRREVEKC